jgi:hypothetical protein
VQKVENPLQRVFSVQDCRWFSHFSSVPVDYHHLWPIYMILVWSLTSVQHHVVWHGFSPHQEIIIPFHRIVRLHPLFYEIALLLLSPPPPYFYFKTALFYETGKKIIQWKS